MAFWSLLGLGLALPISGAIAYRILTWKPKLPEFKLPEIKIPISVEIPENVKETLEKPVETIKQTLEKPIQTAVETIQKPIETVREIKIEMPSIQQLPQIIQLPSFPNLQFDASINNNMLLYAGLGLGLGLTVLGALK